MFQVEDKVIYAEIKENQVTKRFVFPVEDSLIDKLNILHTEFPKLSLQGVGTGTVTKVLIEGAEGANEALDSIPSGVTSLYQVQFDQHPDISSGQARFSDDLLEVVREIELVSKKQEAPSLADQLKSQLKTALPVVKEESGQVDLFDFIAKKKEEKKIPTLEQKLAEAKKKNQAEKQPSSTSYIITAESNQKISEIHDLLSSLHRSFHGEEKEVTGRELAKWFNDYSYDHGADKAWEHIASKISDWA